MNLKVLIAIIITCALGTAHGKFYQEPVDAIIKIEREDSTPLKMALPENLNVIVWNIYKGKKKSFASDLEKLSKDADLLLLQETHLKQKVKDALSKGPHSYHMGVSFKMRGTPTGVSTGSTVSPNSVDYQRSKRELGFTTPKISLITKYNIATSGEELMVINIHGINFVTLGSFKKQINALLDVINSHSGPILFAGDFNTWSKSKYSFLQSSLKEAGLTEATFEEDNRLRAPIISRIGKYNNPLDNVFVRGMIIKEAKVLSNFKGSDHHPIRVKLEL
ncbi:MAG: hypothetical protein CME70_11975 [Halobacteriovorax sp.]|nr:hypothetical protein [Halobacteriovorax sp.]|tara:strand:+ start:318264 stop:319094 length:831 start_codon:yes stop_codon:yes gene_type:complete